MNPGQRSGKSCETRVLRIAASWMRIARLGEATIKGMMCCLMTCLSASGIGGVDSCEF